MKSAVNEYKAALESGDPSNVDAGLLQLKIADLGAPAAAPAAAALPADSTNKAKP